MHFSRFYQICSNKMDYFVLWSPKSKSVRTDLLFDPSKKVNTRGTMNLDEPKRISVNTRGHHQKVRQERYQKAARAKSFFKRTANSWNSLPKHVIDAPSVDSFKKRLDEAWESKWYKSVAV